ncbi:HNH endonuclease signature motif containing protein [Blastococcus litoris]|uniref:HNH endonuclease signature motif containing protein n=1 Tax=Blastococcus litoris TaxID=2171622 RepID=UPI000E3042C9|nr:HNH endonuclease signature motif containing protein [Blastococcus litoris]
MGSNDDGGIPLEELALAITSGAVRLAAATASWLRLVREFDARCGWHGVGILSCAHWLAWQCAMGPGAAREHVRVARSLAGLPRIEAAFAAGRLSYSKVRALTRIAAPDCEEALVEFALHATASQTERFCREWRRADDANTGTVRREGDGQSFEHWYDDDGFLTLKVRMPADAGAALMTAIDARAERDARRERAQAKRALRTHAAIRAAGGTVDAEVAERCADDTAVRRVRERTAARRITALAELTVAGAGQGRRPGDPPRREVVVHVDAAVLADDAAAGRAHYEGGPAITGAQARRLLCEATVVAMLERDGEPLAMGRRRRRATKAQRRALLRRDGGCARPGCPETRIERLHAHHLRHWIFGGRTDVAGMVLLCDVDHGLVHEHELVMSRSDGRLVVTAPDGRRVWGGADAAFAVGLDGPPPDPTSGEDAYAGVEPIDTTIGRRPTRGTGRDAVHGRRPPHGPRRSSRRPGRARRARAVDPARESRRLDRILSAAGAPTSPPVGPARNDRLDMAYAIGVLMANRDLVRRLAAGEQAPG